MIRFDPRTNVVVMDLVDAEHCGFSVGDYHGELFLDGFIDQNNKLHDPAHTQVMNPFAIIVNFGGHVLTPGTSEEKLAAYRERQKQFADWLGSIGFDDSEQPKLETFQDLRLRAYENIARYAVAANQEPHLDFAKVRRLLQDLGAMANNPTLCAKAKEGE
jgi:hypothetical protein